MEPVVSYYLLENGRGVFKTAVGAVPGDMLLSSAQSFTREFAEVGPNLVYWLNDYSQLDGTGITVEHVRQIVRSSLIGAREHPGLLMAIVASQDFEFALSRMWAALAGESEWSLAVFRRADEAATWLQDQLGYPIDFGTRELIATYLP